MRAYERTHGWINFTLDMREVNHKTWMLLGEAQSKCFHIMHVPLLPSVAEQFYKIYLARGVLATTAIEGNTLTEEEVRERLEGRLKLPPSKQYLGQEIDNIVGACNEIAHRVLGGKPMPLNVDDIKRYNLMILNKLPLDENVVPGEIRDHPVVVGRYQGAPAEDCEYLLEQMCDWLDNRFDAPNDDRLAFGILKAIVAHIYMAWIHPFGDGNGRTARLLEFQILLKSGVPSAAAHLLSNHYNQTRTEYYRQLDQAHRSGGDIRAFIQYALQGFVDGLKTQLEMIQQQQLTVHWINYVHDQFKGTDNVTQSRRRHLILDLSAQNAAVPVQGIRHITPRIAEDYAKKTDKTLRRDLNTLEEMGLLVKLGHGHKISYRARSEVILGFLPETLAAE